MRSARSLPWLTLEPRSGGATEFVEAMYGGWHHQEPTNMSGLQGGTSEMTMSLKNAS